MGAAVSAILKPVCRIPSYFLYMYILVSPVNCQPPLSLSTRRSWPTAMQPTPPRGVHESAGSTSRQSQAAHCTFSRAS
eukprot:scaffold31013_cov110-Isochrysis_galbana.AAC.10